MKLQAVVSELVGRVALTAGMDVIVGERSVTVVAENWQEASDFDALLMSEGVRALNDWRRFSPSAAKDAVDNVVELKVGEFA